MTMNTRIPLGKIGDALLDAGFNQFEHQLTTVLANYFGSGGTDERLKELIEIAKRMLGRGHQSGVASSDLLSSAPTRQPVEGGKANEAVPQGHPADASLSSSNRGQEDQYQHVQKDQRANVFPVREPTSTQRSVAGIIAKASAITVLDTLKVDGRAIGDWTVGEARRLGPQKTREGFILTEATRKVANARGYQLIRTVLKVDELQAIMQKAAEISDAA